MRLEPLTTHIIKGHLLSKEEALALVNEPLEALAKSADTIRAACCGNTFELCTIINGKSGQCSENCAYCAQSSHFKTTVETYGLLGAEEVVDRACANAAAGIARFSIVTSGRALSADEVTAVCRIYRKIREKSTISLCASHGLLTPLQFKKLKESGVSRYHNNLETSARYFPKICTTHSYQDKIEALKNARRAGLSLCSGGILGLSETMEDRIDLAITLRALEVDSIPINVLNPIAGTPFEHHKVLAYEDVIKTLSIFRMILPKAQIRLAGGRALLYDKGQSAMRSGVNAAISGHMLTTEGMTTAEDIAQIKALGFEVISHV